MISIVKPMMRGISATGLLAKPNKAAGAAKSLFNGANSKHVLFYNKPPLPIAKPGHGILIGCGENRYDAVRDMMNRRNFMLTGRNAASDCVKMTPALAKIKKLQKHYQKDDGKPIFLKGGKFDELLYRFTWLLCFIGLIMDIDLYLYYIID